MSITETPVETLCQSSHRKETCYVRHMDFDGIQNYLADFLGCNNYNGSAACTACGKAILQKFPRESR